MSIQLILILLNRQCYRLCVSLCNTCILNRSILPDLNRYAGRVERCIAAIINNKLIVRYIIASNTGRSTTCMYRSVTIRRYKRSQISIFIHIAIITTTLQRQRIIILRHTESIGLRCSENIIILRLSKRYRRSSLSQRLNSNRIPITCDLKNILVIHFRCRSSKITVQTIANTRYTQCHLIIYFQRICRSCAKTAR